MRKIEDSVHPRESPKDPRPQARRQPCLDACKHTHYRERQAAIRVRRKEKGVFALDNLQSQPLTGLFNLAGWMDKDPTAPARFIQRQPRARAPQIGIEDDGTA